MPEERKLATPRNHQRGVSAPLNMPGWTKLLVVCQIPHGGLEPFNGFINILGKGIWNQEPDVATLDFVANILVYSSLKRKGQKNEDLFFWWSESDFKCDFTPIRSFSKSLPGSLRVRMMARGCAGKGPCQGINSLLKALDRFSKIKTLSAPGCEKQNIKRLLFWNHASSSFELWNKPRWITALEKKSSFNKLCT